MKIEGTHTINASPNRVYDLLTDPDCLTRCLPGTEKLEKLEHDTYRLIINAGVGPIKGRYNGTVKIENQNPSSNYQMIVEVKGKTGFVKGEGLVDLQPENENTLVTYSGNINVGGPVAAVGQRMIQSTARLITRQFFGAINAEASASQGEEVKHTFARHILRGFKK